MSPAREHWEHFPHEADVGIRGRGPTVGSAFAQAALAMTAAVTDPERVKPVESVDIACEAPNLDALFFDWIDAIVFEMSTRQMLFCRFEVHIEGTRLQARIWGERVEPARHQPAVEVKGPTYTELHVVEDAATRTWSAQCVIDV